MTRDLARLLRPKSVAVIGGGWGVAVIEQCLKAKFEGPVWPVHPTRDEICGLPCVRSVEDLPDAPDAAFVAVNRHLTIETVAALSARGAGGAVCFASGFAEAEDDRTAGANLQADLIAAAGEMPVLGPNCYGFVNYLDNALLWPDQHGGVPVESGVAIITQSSNMLINLTMQRRGLPLAYALAAGNQAQTGIADLAMAVMEDARVTAVGLHIEGIGDIRAFEAMAARARDLGKPVIALKVGRSAQARAATVSHTASLAGGDTASRTFLARQNIPVIDGLPAFLETLKLLHVRGPLGGRAICSMSCSGGEAALVADAAEGHRVDFRPLTDDQAAQVKATLSDLVTIANPLDYHTFIWDDLERMTATYAAMLGSGFDLSMLIYDYPRADRNEVSAWQGGEDAIISAAQQTGAATAMVASLPENMPEDRAARLLAAGIVPLCGLDEAMIAVEAAADIHDGWHRPAASPVLLPSGSADVASVTLDEGAAKGRLSQYGLPVPVRRDAATPQDAAAEATELGFPVVLKRLGHAHKSEAGAVKLGLTSAVAVEDAAQWMSGDGAFLVETQIAGGVAEMIVGVNRDPVYGLTLTVGSGGVLTELVGDSQTLLIPSEESEIRAAILELRLAAFFDGFRGKPAANLDDAIRAVMCIQAFAMVHADEVLELDVNPLILTPDRAVAADALLRVVLSDDADTCCH